MRAAGGITDVSLCCHGMTFMRVIIGQATRLPQIIICCGFNWFSQSDRYPYVSIRSGMVT
jgi:hypothetical protein